MLTKRDSAKPADGEEKLRASETSFRLLVDSIRDYAIFMLDRTGHVASWNPGAQRFKGYTADEIIGRHFSAFYPPEEVASGKCERELEIASETGRFEEEGWRVRKDGSRFWANVVISAIRDSEQRLVGFAKVTRDLTERRRAEEERSQLAAAEQANRTKDEFLAMLSHELRNPLAPIVTALQLMKMRPAAGELAKERHIIERQVQHMVRLVDDLLDVSRISQGKIELKMQPLELSDVVSSAVDMARPLVEQRRHDLTVDVPRSGLGFTGDAVRMAQIIANLLTNAAKYTDEGGTIAVRAARENDDIVVRVEDNGLGIAADLLPRIFDPFVQAPRGMDRSEGGLGIGLTLVRSLLQLHSGSVRAYSDGPGRGSTFVIRLPMEITAVDQRPGQRLLPKERARPRKVLVVDDNTDAAVLLAELLTTRGHDVRVAYDGVEAMSVVSEFTPDAAVLDIGLPIMDGHELARRLREMLGRRCALIALTGYGRAEDRHKSRAAGFDTHLVKPVDPAQIVRLIETAND